MPWHDSDVLILMEQDIAARKNKTPKLSELQKTREEYMAMDLTLFHRNLYQTVDSGLKLESKVTFDKKKKRPTFQFV
eukprot:3173105-Ditylum_brightwellii.AAC.1